MTLARKARDTLHYKSCVMPSLPSRGHRVWVSEGGILWVSMGNHSHRMGCRPLSSETVEDRGLPLAIELRSSAVLIGL